ncbi:hypothetical protein [Thalassomonas sp. M1454]|uniref:hypothetical protein n=1 Tax=Thalassomonas sp. M1454 TaxID=2594477 RepID=UPI00117ED125|nr:hypothetical protein [Thalassomonas sp. M1454]TRX57168.1 hypothetical protein FNN08_06630 [Thalassomonas sp. M1454]
MANFASKILDTLNGTTTKKLVEQEQLIKELQRQVDSLRSSVSILKKNVVALKRGQISPPQNAPNISCPKCRSHWIAKKQYGLPNFENKELREQLSLGEITLGGCVRTYPISKSFYCNDCKLEFNATDKYENEDAKGVHDFDDDIEF